MVEEMPRYSDPKIFSKWYKGFFIEIYDTAGDDLTSGDYITWSWPVDQVDEYIRASQQMTPYETYLGLSRERWPKQA